MALSAETPARARRVARPGWAVAVMVAAQMLIWLDNSILNIAVPTLADPVRGLGAGPEQIEWAITSYSLVLASAMFAGGALADRYGPRRTLVAGLLLFAGASAVAAFAPGAAVLIAARGGMGVGSALLMPSTLSIIVHVTAPERRARAIAMWASSSGVGVAIGPVGGGLLLRHFWWGSVFLVNVPFVLLCLVGVALVVPPLRYPERRRLDPAGLLLSLAGLGGVSYGIITGSRTGLWLRPGTAIPLAAGLLASVAFVLVQRASAAPSFDARLFGRREFAAGSLGLLFAFSGLAGQLFYAAFYLQSAHGLDPLRAGVTMLPAAVGIVAGNQVAPALAARWPARHVVAAGMLAVVGTYASYLFFDGGTPLWWFGLMLLVQGLGMGLVSTPVTTVMMAVLPAERTGAGSAVNSAMRQVGSTLGVAVIGSILTAAYRRAAGPAADGLPSLADPAAFLHAMDVATVWTCGLSLLGVLIVLGWMRPPGER